MNRAELLGLRTFHMIAEHRTLRAAAAVLGVNASAVSQQLKAFEEQLGTALFVRNTRSVVLTDAGHALHERTRHMLSEADAALEAIRSSAGEASGPLRITLPFRAWQLAIAPRLASFRLAFPGVELDLSIDEELTDIVARGFHAGIRLGDYLSGDVIAVALTKPMQGAYVAAPAYLDTFGRPKEPSDLLDHECIRYRRISTGQIAQWEFLVNGNVQTISVTGSLVFNDLRSVIDATCDGFGIGWSLKAGLDRLIESGLLAAILTDFTPERPGFFLYFPRQLQDMPRLRAFIDHFSLGAAPSPESSM
ncbi:LysR family transcriptional regulator [Roseibium sp.]|uniref:LysR family transcriptional regulator n=2 Tax=Roseibium sp. TaxID=1936156 RepID=UPI003264E54D